MQFYLFSRKNGFLKSDLQWSNDPSESTLLSEKEIDSNYFSGFVCHIEDMYLVAETDIVEVDLSWLIEQLVSEVFLIDGKHKTQYWINDNTDLDVQYKYFGCWCNNVRNLSENHVREMLTHALLKLDKIAICALFNGVQSERSVIYTKRKHLEIRLNKRLR